MPRRAASQESTAVTLRVRPADVASLVRTLRDAWGVEPVELSRPGERTVWVELYFHDAVAAALAARALEHHPKVVGLGVRNVRDGDGEWAGMVFEFGKRRPGR